ncbi:MAG: NADH-quinone oxidoreductase subunit M [Thermoguttaceae bacterium]|nr:NADH-quinone oxidoreductase subunit M [Thermoguttaceae bacterium]MDW8037457.1 NADH-quinone oxidoreductase subunit M [Thermoguttaceae bacterium]
MTEAGARVLLLVSLISPLAGTILLGRDRVRARQSALATTIFTLVLCVLVIAAYPPGAKEFARLSLPWGPELSATQTAPMVSFSLGLDGLNLWLYGLTALLAVVGVLISWEAIQYEAARFYRCWLLLETGMLGVFLAQDILLFYVFFEFTLVPLFVLIGLWGSEQRQYAAVKFFLFTLAGSVLTFLGLLGIVLWVHIQTDRLTFSIPDLTEYLLNLHGDDRMPLGLQLVIFWALFAGFAIKVPLFPLHTWLPLAHVEAPAAGSVVLAGVLLKVGGYGFLRFNIPMLPEATAVSAPYLLILSVAGIVYGALVALAQKDIKRLIAYSSISHLGFCMMGIFALNRSGGQGGLLQMLNHGLSTGALFALVGMLYERYHTRQMADLGGLAGRLPWLAFFMVLASLASIGLPGLNGFVGEFLALWGMFHRAWVAPPPEWAFLYRGLSIAALSGVVLGAWYMLWMLERVFFGPLREPLHWPAENAPAPLAGQEHQRAAGDKPVGSTAFEHAGSPQAEAASGSGGMVMDLCWREIAALAPLAILMLWIGVYPKFFLDRIAPTLEELLAPAASSVGDTKKLQEPVSCGRPAFLVHESCCTKLWVCRSNKLVTTLPYH